MADRGERNPSVSKPKPETSSINDDFISSMPDEILHHIISSFNPTNLAVKTSLLSRRWRHVWCETPCLSFRGVKATPQVINQTLISYRALKITSFRLDSAYYVKAREINSWIKFAMSRSVHELSVSFLEYTCPDFLFFSSSLEKLYVTSALFPRCTTVSWKNLRNLTLSSCDLSEDESIANILSGCPILETLEMSYCFGLPQRLDLSKSLSLRKWSFQSSYPVEIIAPQIHYLKLTITDEPCTLVDVSSVTEASLEICYYKNFFSVSEFVQIMVLKLLEKLQNVGRLTFGRTLLQILSLAELCGRPFPMLRVQTLIVETMVVRSAIPGITRLLQNSPVMKKLIAQATCSGNINDHGLDYYLGRRGLYLDQCWGSEYIHDFPTSKGIGSMVRWENAASELLTLFLELVLRNTKTLEMMVVQFRSTHPLALEWFAQLLQMPPTLLHNNNVSIVLNPSNYSLIASVSLY